MRKRSGFTLVEMLASTGIGAIVLLLAVASLSTTGEQYGRSTDSVAAERESRAVLTLVAEDMSKASAGILEIEESTETWKKDRLGFTCLQPSDAQAESEAIGDLCLVYYYVKDLELGRDTVRCLMRGFRSSDEVFSSLRNGRIEELYEERVEDEPVSFGVLAFEAEGLIRQEGGAWEVWEQTDDDPLAEMPDVIRLKLVVARRELASKLRTTADWDSSPLIGNPDESDRSDQLEIYQIIHPFGHAR